MSEREDATEPSQVALRLRAKTVLAPVTLAVVEGRERLRRRPPKPGGMQRFARQWLANDLPAILETCGDAASGGDTASLKALMTLCGFDREMSGKVEGRTRRGRSLAKILLDDLRRNPPATRAAATRDEPWPGGRKFAPEEDTHT